MPHHRLFFQVRLGLCLGLCLSLSCRTTSDDLSAPPTANHSPPGAHPLGGGAALPSNPSDSIGSLVAELQSAASTYLKSPGAASNHSIAAAAKTLAGMNPASLEGALSDSQDFTQLQADLNGTALSIQGNRATDPTGLIEGRLSAAEYQQITAAVPSPYANIYTFGKVLIGLGVAAVFTGYFLQYTNSEYKKIAAQEDIKAAHRELAEIGAKELAKAKNSPEKSPEVAQEVSPGKTPAQPNKTPVQNKSPSAEIRFKASKYLKYGGVAAALAGIAVLVGPDAMSTYSADLVGSLVGSKNLSSSTPGLPIFMLTLAKLEVRLLQMYQLQAVKKSL